MNFKRKRQFSPHRCTCKYWKVGWHKGKDKYDGGDKRRDIGSRLQLKEAREGNR